MASYLEIDLTYTLSWLGLLECMSALSRMAPGEILEVLLKDPEAVGNLVRILKRSRNQVLQSKSEGTYYRVCIQKG